MGASLASPLPHRPPTSVCNHLFSPPDAPLFPSNGKRQSVLAQGWHWGKKAISPTERKHDHENQSSRSYDGPTWRAQRELPYTQLPISVDNNQNYRSYGPETTVIPNYYSIRDELQRENLRFSKQDFVNNNLVSPPRDKAKTPLSPKHTRHFTHVLSKSDSVCSSQSGGIIQRVELKSQSCYRLSTPSDIKPSIDPLPLSARVGGHFKQPINEGNESRRGTNPSVHHITNESNRATGRRTVVQASTSELLRALGAFVLDRCPVSNFEPAHVVMWLRTVDRALLLQGWQDVAFINPANLVFVYLLVRDVLPGDDEIKTMEELHQWLLTCLYIGYSYMGNEISYPLKPFIIEADRDRFWERTVEIIKAKSADMLRLNASSAYFTEIFTELKKYADTL